MDASFEENSKLLWNERRKRLAIKKLGGVKVILFKTFLFHAFLLVVNFSVFRTFSVLINFVNYKVKIFFF